MLLRRRCHGRRRSRCCRAPGTPAGAGRCIAVANTTMSAKHGGSRPAGGRGLLRKSLHFCSLAFSTTRFPYATIRRSFYKISALIDAQMAVEGWRGRSVGCQQGRLWSRQGPNANGDKREYVSGHAHCIQEAMGRGVADRRRTAVVDGLGSCCTRGARRSRCCSASPGFCLSQAPPRPPLPPPRRSGLNGPVHCL